MECKAIEQAQLHTSEKSKDGDIFFCTGLHGSVVGYSLLISKALMMRWCFICRSLKGIHHGLGLFEF